MENHSNPQISVIVAIYQVGEFLSKCLDSIISQTYDNLQIILVDDGSTDESIEICNSYAQIDKRIEVYHKKNGGLVSARKFGLKKAKGEYVAFVDGDDFIDGDMYAVMCATMQSTNADFVSSGYKIVKLGQVCGAEKPMAFQYEVTTEADRTSLIEDGFFGYVKNSNIFPSIWSKVFKIDFIEKCYSYVPDGQDYGEDLICLFCSLTRCKKLVSLDETFYNYSIREGSITNVEREMAFFKELKLYQVLFDVNKQLLNPVDDSSMYMWIREKTKDLMTQTSDAVPQNERVQYYFRNSDLFKGKSVVIYGAGVVGKDYYAQLIQQGDCNVVGVFDQGWKSKKINEFEVFDPNLVKNLEYDFVIIAMRDKNLASSVRQELEKMGVSPMKIIWEKPCV